MFEVDGAVQRAAIVLQYTILLCGLAFEKIACAIAGVMGGVGLLEDTLVTTRLLNNHCSESVNVVDILGRD